MGYKYYLGPYDSKFKISISHRTKTAYGEKIIPAGLIELGPWELKHVKDITVSINSSSESTIGIPDKPAECVQVFDTGGPVRTITISGIRYDAEEEISNLDFILTQFNMQSFNGEYDCFKSTTQNNVCSVGLEWLTSTIQSTLMGYVFRITIDKDEKDERVPVVPLNNSETYIEEYNVGVMGFSCSFSADNAGIMEYTITLVERKKYDGGPTYREYIPKY